MPKDIKRKFLTGPRTFDEIMEKLEIIVNKMTADVGRVPMDLTRRQSYEDVCATAWKGYKAGKGAGKKGPNGSGTWHRGKGADEWPSGRRQEGRQEGPQR